MTVSPALGENLAGPLLKAYADAERALLERIARALAQGLDAPDWAERKLIEIRFLQAATLRDLDNLGREAAGHVDTAIRTAQNRGSAAGVADLMQAGYPAKQVAIGLPDVRGLDSLISETLGMVVGTHQRILRSVVDAYRDVVARASQQVLLGSQTRREAAQAALDAFAGRGITGFIDTAGRGWDMASYVEMGIRSATGRAAIAAHSERLVAFGQDLVMVSDAPQECELCRPWEGAILSLSGATIGAIDVDGQTIQVAGSLAEAEAAGLHHNNCRHAHSLYQPGYTNPRGKTADPQGDADRRELRRLERGVREWKRREAAALDDPAATRARAKVRQWQAKIREHTDATSAKRQPAREQIGSAR